MSNLNSKVNASVRNLVEFIKTSAVNNIIAANRSGNINLNDRDLSVLLNLVESSIYQGYTIGYTEMESLLREEESARNKVLNREKKSESKRSKKR